VVSSLETENIVSSPDGDDVKIATDCGITAESESNNLPIILRALRTFLKSETESNFGCFLEGITPLGDMALVGIYFLSVSYFLP